MLYLILCAATVLLISCAITVAENGGIRRVRWENQYKRGVTYHVGSVSFKFSRKAGE